MIGLTNTQQKIQGSLITAINNSNYQGVEGVFGNEDYDDIQAVLSYEGVMDSHKDTILDYAIMHLNDQAKAQGKIRESVGIIKKIWQKADQKTRDFVCDHAIDSFQGYPEVINSSNIDIYPDLKEVIQKVEKHKKVKDLHFGLRRAIKNLDVEQVKTALKDNENAAMVSVRHVYWKNGDVDFLLFYPLMVRCNQENVEKRKEIFELMLSCVSPQIRYHRCENGDYYVMNTLKKAQGRFAAIPEVGEECFRDLIDKFEQELSEEIIKEFEAEDQVARDKILVAYFSQKVNKGLLVDNELNAFIDDTGSVQNQVISTASPVPTTGNTTPEKNDTNCWSEHKGKIALGGVTGLCVAGAIAAYALAYPLVALALTVLAAVILMGAGIAKVLEDPSVEKPFAQREVH